MIDVDLLNVALLRSILVLSGAFFLHLDFVKLASAQMLELVMACVYGVLGFVALGHLLKCLRSAKCVFDPLS